MNNTIVITRYHDAILYMLQDEHGPVELKMFFDSDEVIGSIYVCEIKDVKPGIGASFINYGKDQNGYLNSTAYKSGTLVPLQLKKAGTQDKAPVFTDELSIAGIYTVLTNANREFRISAKLSGEKRNRLKKDYSSFFSDLEYGVTLRTNSADAPLKEVIREADDLAGILDDILTAAKTRTIGNILYSQPHEWLKYCMGTDLKSIIKVVTDDSDIFKVLEASFLNSLRSVNPEAYLSLYSDNMLPLDKLYSIGSALKNASGKKINLRSGGFLYIERTEALTAIDVNTGKQTDKKEKEETFYKCNLEATEEICRQLRLRNLSGIILIDYINMTEKEHIESVISTLKKLIALDPVKTTFHDCTALNLIELTRQKIREPLDEQLKRLNAASDNTGWK